MEWIRCVRAAVGRLPKLAGMVAVMLVCLWLTGNGPGPVKPQPVRAAGESWLTGYSYRKQITIDSSKVSDLDSADLTNFPVLISLTGLSDIQANGADIRFTAQDGATELPREIISYASGALKAWVKIPTLDYNTDTVIYMYFGNAGASEPAADATYGSRNVWTNSYAGVWHLKETGTNPTVNDATANANNSSAQTWTPATGYIGGGGSFNGSSNSINFTSADSLNPTSITISAWVYADVNNKWQHVSAKNGQWNFGRDNGGKYYLAAWNADGTNVADEHSVTSATTGQWEHIVFTYDGSRAKYYVNNSAVIDKAVSGNLRSTTTIATIGSQGGDGNYWDGMIDEVRIASVARSAGWIATEYTNQSAPASFATASATELQTSDWDTRKRLIIDHTKVGNGTEDESNFPVLISLSGLSGINAGGTDVRFTASDGKTLLPREIESYSGGTLVAWVKIPTLSHTTDTEISLYYGNTDATEPAADSTYGSQNVWNDAYEGIWHMDDNAANTTITDSTVNANSGTAQQQTSALTVSGKVNGAITFNGTSDYVRKATFTSSPGSQMTVCGWVKTSATNTFLVSQARSLSSYEGEYIFQIQADGKVSFWDNNGTEYGFPEADNAGNTSITDNAWHYACFVKNATSGTYYLDGNADGTVTADRDVSYLTANFVIGSDYRDGSRFFSGTMDELRISSAARSAGWIATEYNNQSSPSTFFSIAGESTPTPTSTPSPTSAPANQVAPTATPTPNPAVAPVCTEEKPSGIPKIDRIETTNTQAILFIAPVDGISKYFISYSTNPSAEEHGAEIQLNQNGVQQFTVSHLGSGMNYFFKVRGARGCMPGDWSAVVSASTKRPDSGFVTTALEAVGEQFTPKRTMEIISQTLTHEPSDVCSYTVAPGDTLWSIAVSKLGDGSRFTALRELNAMESTTLSSGQKLKLPCDGTQEGITRATEEVNQQGVSLSILVKDKGNKPVEGVTVTLHSKIQTAKTDKDGIARFTDVEPGDHRVLLAYNNYNGEQSLNVTMEQKEQTLTLKVEMSSGFSSPAVKLVIGGMGGIIGILLVILLKNPVFQQKKLAKRS